MHAMLRRVATILVCLTFSLAAVGASAVVPIRMDFSGKVDLVDDTFFPGVAKGDPFSGWLVYDPSVSGTGSLSGVPYGLSFDYGGGTVYKSSLFAFAVANGNCPLAAGTDCVRFGMDLHVLNFVDISGNQIAGVAMPSPEVLAGFPIITLTYFDPRGTGSKYIGTVDTINFAPVPEPSTWLLMAGGGVLVAVAARRRQRGS